MKVSETFGSCTGSPYRVEHRCDLEGEFYVTLKKVCCRYVQFGDEYANAAQAKNAILRYDRRLARKIDEKLRESNR